MLVGSAEVKIGKHVSNSKFVVGDTRYDVVLGTPWHKDVNPLTDYDQSTVQIGNTIVFGKQARFSEHEKYHLSIKGFQKC